MEPRLSTPEELQPVLRELQVLEPIFHSAYFDATPEKFDQLVAPHFWEVGASGNRYSREFVRQVLSQRKNAPDAAAWQTSDWHLAEAGPGHYLLTYTLFQPGRATRRLSVWRRSGDGWQVTYHQGTVMAAPIRAVLFDFDGVLTTDKTGSITTARSLSRLTGIELPRIQAALRRFNPALTRGETTHEAIWPQVCRELGQAVDIALLQEAFASTPINERMMALARRLRPAYAVGIVTDNKKDRIDCLKHLHALPSLFDPIVVSAEVGSGKEDALIFETAMQRLGLRADECVFIDNSRDNLVAADRLGMKTIFFDDEKQDFEALHAALAGMGVNCS
jgi:putative hydrolase of the HAD superfamily